MDTVELVLENLRKYIESDYDANFGTVYLDNARPKGVNDKQFRACLSALSKKGLYKPIDGLAFGAVRRITK